MQNTRTFTDLDLNFLPAPSSQDRYIGTGTISFTNLNSIVTGTNTIFLTFLDVGNNLYVNTAFLGKIKSIISDTSIELYEVVSLPSEIHIEYSYSLPADISVKTDANAIKAAVKHLVLTSNYERHFHSDVGSQVRAIMFEPATPMTQILLQRSIVDVINSYEPRVQLIEVIVSLDNPSYSANVTIFFQIINTTQPLRIDLVLERAR